MRGQKREPLVKSSSLSGYQFVILSSCNRAFLLMVLNTLFNFKSILWIKRAKLYIFILQKNTYNSKSLSLIHRIISNINTKILNIIRFIICFILMPPNILLSIPHNMKSFYCEHLMQKENHFLRVVLFC